MWSRRVQFPLFSLFLWRTKIRHCKHCNKDFNIENGRIFSNHVRWCKENPNKNTDKIGKGVSDSYDRRLGKKKPFKVMCHICNKRFDVIERAKKHPEKEKYYCSVFCQHSRILTQKSKDKIRNSLLGRQIVNREAYTCLECGKINFDTPSKRRIFCSKTCRKNRKKRLDESYEFREYKTSCRFKFSVKDYPDYFDLDLIKTYGFYKAANHGNNLTGVSRDHKISVMFGWENNIDPEIMSHPANCQLMLHSENSSKNKSCSITLEQLLKDIQNWKHGELV